MRITNFILDKIYSDEIEEILELRVGQSNPDLLEKIFSEKKIDLGMLSHLRYLFTKLLFVKLIMAFYLYNKGLNYFFEQAL